jgi:hypothetical protein
MVSYRCYEAHHVGHLHTEIPYQTSSLWGSISILIVKCIQPDTGSYEEPSDICCSSHEFKALDISFAQQSQAALAVRLPGLATAKLHDSTTFP